MPVKSFKNFESLKAVLSVICDTVNATQLEQLNTTVSLETLNDNLITIDSIITHLDNMQANPSEYEVFSPIELQTEYSKTKQIKTKLEDLIELLEQKLVDKSVKESEILAAIPPSIDSDLRHLFSKFLESQTATNLQLSNQLHQTQDSQTIISQLSSIVENLSNHSPSHASAPRLQSISIPIFSGDLCNWTTFKELYTSLIHNDPKLTKVQKMHYLMSSLSGQALEYVDNITISADNYDSTWESLLDRYGDSYSIVNAYIQRLLSIPSLSNESYQALSQMRATMNSVLRALKSFSLTGGDHWIVFILKDKLDTESKRLWARECKGKIPSYNDFNNFLLDRVRELETCSESSSKSKLPTTKLTPQAKTSLLVSASTSGACHCCQSSTHKLYQCDKFKQLSPPDRLALVRDNSLCRNCIVQTHLTKECPARGCYKCNSKHNSLLHEAFTSGPQSLNASARPQNSNLNAAIKQTLPVPQSHISIESASNPHSEKDVSNSNTKSSIDTVTLTSLSSHENPKIFLGTVIVKILDFNGEEHLCRAVVDNCSQSNLITTSLSQKLKLSKFPSKFEIGGVTDRRTTGNYKTQICIAPRTGGDFHEMCCKIVPKITGNLPNWIVNSKEIPIPAHLTLADPTWHVQQPIDLLIGAGVFARIEQDKSYHMGPNFPKLKASLFGWILMGEHKTPSPATTDDYSVCNITTLSSIDNTLRKFWEMETIPNQVPLSTEQQEVEDLYRSSTTRNKEGRFVVHLPFRSNVNRLADNKSNAISQFLRLERKLNQNPSLKNQYASNISEYLNLGFLEPVPAHELHHKSYYLPHHGVVKESSTSTKLRIVYNASSKSSSGLSLNDTLKVGPIVQPDLISTMLRFRVGKFAFSCDVSKMYPQFLLHEPHRDYQRIIWRFKSEDDLQHYRLKGVCFGVASSPFLATRSLNQLAIEESDKYPLAAQTILQSFYVDDCLASFSSFSEALTTQHELIEAMANAGLTLAKWNSNCSELIPDVKLSNQCPDSVSLPEIHTKALGMKWNIVTDSFTYDFTPLKPSQYTKRVCFSLIASLFDPLGLIGPVIIQGKLLLQALWKLNLEWDQALPPNIETEFHNFLSDLSTVKSISIPRWLSVFETPSTTELHLFTDSSNYAYGAVIYFVTQNSKGEKFSRLLVAKSRVAPIKALTIPRLELCGAVLGARLLHKILSIFSVSSYYCWTDSQIVLSQINATTEKFDTFVSHRISEIQERTMKSSWRHVPGDMNPADILSRGIKPQALGSLEQWWCGPHFLKQNQSDWPSQFVHMYVDLKDDTFCGITAENSSQSSSFLARCAENSSDFDEFTRLIAISRRFFTHSKEIHSHSGPITPAELLHAETIILKWEQRTQMGEIYRTVRENTLMSKKKFAHIRQLCPFLDEEGILRVGGRIHHSFEPYSTRHPILVPKGRLARLIAKSEHLRLQHAGPQLLLSSLRRRFWILSGRSISRDIVRNCVRCWRVNPNLLSQRMGDLPISRIDAPIPFKATGIDFAGPVLIRKGQRRSQTLTKTYICVFVCLTTRAVHCEVVSDLSTNAFLACFKRFVARRSAPSDVYSDNATNFVGASRELDRLLSHDNAQREIIDATSHLQIKWHFQPPRSPHCGGLWEAAIKAFKHHFRRVVANEKPNFEELSTITAQIESTLNSRPITELSDDPSDPQALTPGHFLVGRPLTDLPSPSHLHLADNRLDSWQRCQKMVESFAKMWKRDYLSALQKRSKWFASAPNLKKGDIVVVYEDNAPPLSWPLGRIIETHPGHDGRVRVVTIQTARGVYKRSIHKLSKLPEEGLPPSP